MLESFEVKPNPTRPSLMVRLRLKDRVAKHVEKLYWERRGQKKESCSDSKLEMVWALETWSCWTKYSCLHPKGNAFWWVGPSTLVFWSFSLSFML